jgi:hypothetical protein
MFSIGYATGTSRGEKMSLPVAPVQYIYAQFEHVSGVPAPEGIHGVPITKLKILDSLIDQLHEMKEKRNPVKGLFSDESIDTLIEKYEQQIRQSQRIGMVPIPYQYVPTAPVGVLFELVA